MREALDIQQAMDRFGDDVWRACMLYLSPSDAEDVFQEIVKYAFASWVSRRGHAKAWLLRVAMNACKDVLKSRDYRTSSLDEEIQRWGDALADVRPERAAEVREVLDAVDRLDDPPKTPLYLAVCEGYSVPEISRMVKAPEGTVYSWISRGKKILREALS
ncbi:MAG: RNA polymerase sigma factor [Eggerthellaceae bacterium]